MSEIGIWHLVPGGQPTRLLPQALPTETQLEEWIFEDPTLLSSGLRVVARQLNIGTKYIDLLCVEEPGTWVICELKKASLERDILGQAIDYISRIAELSLSDFQLLIKRNMQTSDSHTLDLIEKAFDREANDSDRDMRVLLAGVGVKPELQRMVSHLSNTFSFPISFCTFSALNSPDGEGFMILREIDEQENNSASSNSESGDYKQRMAAVREHFAQNKQSLIFDRIVEELESNPKVYLRPWKKSLMVAPARHHGRYLMYFTPRAGAVFGSFSIEAFSEFYKVLDISKFSSMPSEEYFDNPNSVSSWISEVIGNLEELEEFSVERQQSEWNGKDWYVCYGISENGRNWDDARRLGFISAGGGDWYSRSLFRLPLGARFFAYIPKIGYVGYGVVAGEAVKLSDSKLAGDTSLAGTYLHENGEPEYIVPVKWESTLDLKDALIGRGLFGNQNSACKLSHEYTLQQLYKFFSVAG